MININQLKAFLTVLQTQQFSLAAAQLHLTQPAISKRISNLETALGCSLFDRHHKTARPTEAALTLLPYARTMLNTAAEAQKSIQNLADTVAGSLKLGLSHHIGLHYIPQVLKNYLKTYPHVKLDLSLIDSDQAYGLLEQGLLDVAVVTLNPSEHPGITAIPIWQDTLGFALPEDHTLCQRKRVSLSLLKNYPCILPKLGTFTRELIETLFSKQGHTLEVVLATNYLETNQAMASIGLGWTVLPHAMICKPLCSLNVPGTPLTRQLGYLYTTDRTLSNAAKTLLKAIAKHEKL